MPDTSPERDDRRSLLVKQVRAESSRVFSLTLIDPAGDAVPPWEPGAHLDLVLPSGTIRQYSLCGDDRDRKSYTVAVRHDPGGRGGSHEVHTTPMVGREVRVIGPRNHFPLAAADQHLLVAGGIGITPILAMARTLERTGQAWHVVYCGHRRDMAFVDELLDVNPGRVTIVETDHQGRPDLDALIDRLPAGAAVYCCGPPSLVADVRSSCAGKGLTVRIERFTADPDATPAGTDGDGDIEVELVRSGTTITVPPGRTILDSVREVRPDVPSSCEEGYCGTCETRVLDGTPDHRDDVLGPSEHDGNHTMMICVSRARSKRLVLDL
jgi:ferredoxin-NADP reductase